MVKDIAQFFEPFLRRLFPVEAARRTGDSVVLRWSPHPSCVGLARMELRKLLADWGLAELEDSALLVLSELVTNAARHARVSHDWEIETRYRPGPGAVRIEVHDASPSRPQVRDADPDSLDGRGLILVAALADEWGVGERDDGAAGKVVWARLSLPAATDTDGTNRGAH
ncbi:ATP-binding protein [Streptomyces sp. NPDC059743]|uniref:ATP-binding protein n=1 Tax=Streptomyces sp. NPDC059743 TaxID=3346928 RepID=UPI0036503B52